MMTGVSGAKPSPPPTPTSTSGTSSIGTYPLPGDSRVSRSSPATINAAPVSTSGLGPKRASRRGTSLVIVNIPTARGRNASPVVSALNPRISWRYCVRKKKLDIIAAGARKKAR